MKLFLFLLFIKPFIYERIYTSAHFAWNILLALYLTWFLRRKPGRPKIELVFLRTICLFAVSVVASSLYTVLILKHRYFEVMHLYTLLGGSLLGLLAFSSGSEQQRILKVMVISSAGISLIALYTLLVSYGITLQYLQVHPLPFQFVEEFLKRKRAFFPFVSPDTLGGFLLATIFPTFYFLKKHKWFLGILILQLTALVLTKSVGVLFSLLVALLIYYWKNSSRVQIKHLFLSAAFGLMSISALILFRHAQEKDWYFTPIFSLRNRIDYILQGLRLAKEHPFWGNGLGYFHIYSGTKYVHNLFVQLWAEAGLFTVGTFLGIILITLRRGWKNLGGIHNEEQSLRLCIFCGWCAFLIHNLVDFDFFILQASYVWWVYVGLINYNYITSSENRRQITENRNRASSVI